MKKKNLKKVKDWTVRLKTAIHFHSMTGVLRDQANYSLRDLIVTRLMNMTPEKIQRKMNSGHGTFQVFIIKEHLLNSYFKHSKLSK